MATHCSQIHKKLLTSFLGALAILLLNFLPVLPSYAAAPPRPIPYDEAVLCASADVFFCEDFEGNDIFIQDRAGGGKALCTYGNPAVSTRTGAKPAHLSCPGSGGGTAQGGSVQHPAVNLPKGPDTTSQNQVWRMTKGGKAPNDIVTGKNTGIGQGSLVGFLQNRSGGGIKGVREYYVRYFYRYNQGYDWPEQYDSKQVFTQPMEFKDNPSAHYQNGAYVFRTRCKGIKIPAENTMTLRHSGPYDNFPDTAAEGHCNKAFGPDGMLPTGTVKLNHFYKMDHNWHEIEFYFKLESSTSGNSNDGDMRLWIDGQLLYEQTNTDVCRGGCAELGYFFAGAYMNRLDAPHASFAEMDNLVMSRSRIGSPGGVSGSPTTDTTPPRTPTGVDIQLNIPNAP